MIDKQRAATTIDASGLFLTTVGNPLARFQLFSALMHRYHVA